jgi:hypothetical protein
MEVKMNSGLVLVNLIVIGLAAISYLSLNSIQPLYPLNNMATDDRTPTFEWSGQRGNYELLIDDNPDFSSPSIFDVSGNTHDLPEELPFGTYWWKVRSGDIESAARRFALVSTVALSRLDRNLVRNSGNTALLVHSGGMAGAVTLAVNETLEIGDKENVKAEQK